MNVKPSNTIIPYIFASLILAICIQCIFSFHAAHADSEGPVLPIQSLSNFTCTAGIGNVMLTGYFSNGETPFNVIFLKMLLLDSRWHIIATGHGSITDVKPHEVKAFNAITRFSGNFSSCTVQIDNAIPK